jgi:hypothetical protein
MKLVITCLIAAVWAGPLAAQDAVGTIPDSTASEAERPYRDPQRARLLGSLFPGAGHVYAGEYWRGYVIYLTTVASIGGGVMVYVIDECTFTFLSGRSCNPGPQWPHRLLGIAAVGAGFWAWISGARDAPLAAERANERHRRKTMKVSPFLNPASGSRLGAQVGLTMQW